MEMWVFRKITEFHKESELGLGVSSHEIGDGPCSSVFLCFPSAAGRDKAQMDNALISAKCLSELRI